MAATKPRRSKVKSIAAVSHLNLSGQLLEAVQQGKPKIVKRLLDSRVDINCVTEENESPLLLAASLKDTDARRAITNLLLDRGCQIHTCDKTGQTPLMSAIKTQDYDLVQTLLSKGSDVGHTDHEGNTPLCLAAETGNPDIVQKVLFHSIKNKINVDHKNMRGLTPLLIASQNGHLEVARILVEKGKASVSIRDLENFMTPEDWMQETSFYSPSEFPFLSPKMRSKRNRKGVKTMSHYMNEEPSTGIDSPITFEFDTSITKLPHLVDKHSGGTIDSRSMFDKVSFTQNTKAVPAFSFGKVVPLKPKHSKISSDKLPLLPSSMASNHHSIYSNKGRVSKKRSGFYSEGSLEPLVPPTKGSFMRQDSIIDKHSIKDSQPLPMLNDNHNDKS